VFFYGHSLGPSLLSVRGTEACDARWGPAHAFLSPSRGVPILVRSLRQGGDCEVASQFKCIKVVYNDAMPTTKHVRRSVSLPTPIAKQVERLAKSQRLSDNRVLVELIELGIEARKQKEKAFFELAERFRAASDPQQAKRLGDELGRLVFGE
jgi:hypothetical protein